MQERYLTYAEYLEWRLSQPDVTPQDADTDKDGLDIDGGSFNPWTESTVYTGSTESSGGILSEEAFYVVEFKARKRIDYWTDNRVKVMAEVPEAVKYCMKALIKLEEKFGVEEQLRTPTVASFNTDGYSESYGSASDQQAAADKAMAGAIRQWLYGEKDDLGVPLLYRGVCG